MHIVGIRRLLSIAFVLSIAPCNHPQIFAKLYNIALVAQGIEQRFPKPRVGSSSLSGGIFADPNDPLLDRQTSTPTILHLPHKPLHQPNHFPNLYLSQHFH